MDGFCKKYTYIMTFISMKSRLIHIQNRYWGTQHSYATELMSIRDGGICLRSLGPMESKTRKKKAEREEKRAKAQKDNENTAGAASHPNSIPDSNDDKRGTELENANGVTSQHAVLNFATLDEVVVQMENTIIDDRLGAGERGQHFRLR